jgi:hypothetical protein
MDLSSLSFSTAKGELQLTCISLEEPNNGRMLYGVRLTLDKTDVTNEYFDGWNYINAIGTYEPISEDKKWIYIPKESHHFLINAETLQKVVLPALDFSAVRFIGNFFFGNFLLVIGSKQIISKNLHTGSTAVLPDANTNFEDVQIIDENTIAIIYRDNQTKSIVSIDTLQPK